MADYYPIIARAVANLPQNSDAARRACYDRARSGLIALLRGRSEAEVIRERQSLEDAIHRFETGSQIGVRSPKLPVAPIQPRDVSSAAGQKVATPAPVAKDQPTSNNRADNLESQAAQWKATQKGRLPKIFLPCRHCLTQAEVNFDPPKNCPACGSLFLGKRPTLLRLIQITMLLLIVFFFAYVIPAGTKDILRSPGAPILFQTLLHHELLLHIVGVAILGTLAAFLTGGLEIISSVVKPVREREKWLRYSSAIVTKIAEEERLKVRAWLRARSLLAPYQRFSEWDLIRQDPFVLHEYRKNTSENIRFDSVKREVQDSMPNKLESLLVDLEWVNNFIDCTRTNWLPSEECFESYGCDSPALIDFVKRIQRTTAAKTKSTKGELLLRWIADRTPSTAPRLKELLLADKAPAVA
jgi:hypothetical protein